MDGALVKILTIVNLIKRGMVLANWCSMCNSSEDRDHLLLHCCLARELWELVFTLFGVWLVMPNFVLLMFQGWRRNPKYLQKQSSEFSSFMLVLDVEGEDSKNIRWAGFVDLWCFGGYTPNILTDLSN